MERWLMIMHGMPVAKLFAPPPPTMNAIERPEVVQTRRCTTIIRLPCSPVGPSYSSNGPQWCGVAERAGHFVLTQNLLPHISNTCDNYADVDWAVFWLFFLYYFNFRKARTRRLSHNERLHDMTLFQILWPFFFLLLFFSITRIVLTFGLISRSRDVFFLVFFPPLYARGAFFSRGHVLSFSWLRRSLHCSPPSPISGAPAVHHWGSEAPSISQMHLCGDWIAPRPSGSRPKATSASLDPPPNPKSTSTSVPPYSSPNNSK